MAAYYASEGQARLQAMLTHALALLPWTRTQVAGMPSAALAKLSLLSALCEDVPQLIIQITYAALHGDDASAATRQL